MQEPTGQHRLSIWQATATASSRQPLRGDVDTDVAIVGAGITGLTTAALLADAGARITVLEARDVGAGTTGGTTGKVTSQHGLIYHQLVQRHGEEAARAYGDANEAAIALVHDLSERYALDAELTRSAAYVYTEDESQLAAMERELEVAQRLGLPASWSTTTDLPFDVLGAVRFDGQAQLHAVKYLQGLADVVSGTPECAVHEGSRVVSVEVDGERIVVRTSRGTVRADHVVLATLLPIIDRGFEFARAEPSRTYGVAAVLGDQPAPEGMYISAEQPSRSIRHHHGSDAEYVIVVGGAHRTGAGPDGQPDDALARFVRDRLGANEVRYRWSAQDFMPADLLPFVGEVPFGRRIHVATGFNKWGLTNGTVAARIISDAITGRDNPYAEVFSNGRLAVTASAKKFVEHNAEVAKHFLGGRLTSALRSIDDIPPGEAAVVLQDGEYRAVVKDEQGGVTVRSAVCRHLGCIVQWNRSERSWDCPCHGSRYATDGTVLEGPTTRPLEPSDFS